MSTSLIGMLAETFIHVGAGQNEGVVDLPVAREAVTDYPYVPGSGMKGAFLDWARQQELAELHEIFGSQEKAGNLLFGDARLVALPVRSLQGASRWITSPQLLERFSRDLSRTGSTVEPLDLSLTPGQAMAREGKGFINLEERHFNIVADGLRERVAEELSVLISHLATTERFRKDLIVLHNDDLTWFARYGLSVQARNVLDQDTKVSENLWYEESLPPDALLYTLVGDRTNDSIQSFNNAVNSHPWLQVGGNETVGQGWFALEIVVGTT